MGYTLPYIYIRTHTSYIHTYIHTNMHIYSKYKGALLISQVLCITLLVDKWIRESIVRGCSLWIVLVGHATFLYVTRPTIANSRFPFHIRTCQVVPIGGDGQNHSYEPRFRTVVTAFTIS